MRRYIMSNCDTPSGGLGPYGGGGVPSRPAAVLTMLKRKAALRAALVVEAARIEQVLPSLSEADKLELIVMLQAGDAKADADIAALTVEASRLAQGRGAGARLPKSQRSPLARGKLDLDRRDKPQA